MEGRFPAFSSRDDPEKPGQFAPTAVMVRRPWFLAFSAILSRFDAQGRQIPVILVFIIVLFETVLI